MSKSKIEWTDEVGNVFVVSNGMAGKHGWHCEKISPGCANCYAERINIAQRFGYGTGQTYNKKNEPINLIFRRELCEKWLKVKKKKVVFVNSMTDTFLDCYEDKLIQALFYYMEKAKNLFFIVLTKRPERAIQLEEKERIVWPGNAMFMVTTEDQEQADKRIPVLLQSKAKWKGLSIEPLLGMIDIEPVWLGNYQSCGGWLPAQIHWIIVGAESNGRKVGRECKTEWIKRIINDCKQSNVPLFVKQILIEGKLSKNIEKFPEHLKIREFPL
ncbi:MAG: hypothetical protein A2V66_16785 [Ignavibacteria bacterium RBG_13_36_8]|nr:MAG: hypothetical protein A2V66_16785 [Ignavibacteria bacterium RBG_13_36_8]